jgi:hypothetical protein
VLPTLEQRTASADGELLSFTDADALKALATITKRKPAVVVIERLFAASPRGAALINRIKADPSLTASEIRIVSHDGDHSRVSPGRVPESGSGTAAAVAAPPSAPALAPLDQRGTRRAARFKVVDVEVLVDGNEASLVDLSTIGAQVVSVSALKPNQRVRMSLLDGDGTVRFNASVAWASFEIAPRSGPRYRAGVEFLDADARAVEAYCARHRG